MDMGGMGVQLCPVIISLMIYTKNHLNKTKMLNRLSFIAFICLLSIYSLSAQNNKESLEKDFDNAEKIFAKVYQDGKGEALTYSKECYRDVLPVYLDLY